MDELILDATILIDLSLGQPGAIAFASARPSTAFRVHPVSAAELFVGARDRRELKHLEQLVSRFRPLRPAAQDFDHCLAFVRRHTLTHSVGWPDCLIAAAGLRMRVPVATLNEKHFRVFKGLNVVRPY